MGKKERYRGRCEAGHDSRMASLSSPAPGMHFFGDGDASKGPTYVLSDHETEKYVHAMPFLSPSPLPASSMPCPSSPPPPSLRRLCHALPLPLPLPCVVHAMPFLSPLLSISLSLLTPLTLPASHPPLPSRRARYWLPCLDLPVVRTSATFHLSTLPHHLAFANGVLVEDGVEEVGGASASASATATAPAVKGGEEAYRHTSFHSSPHFLYPSLSLHPPPLD